MARSINQKSTYGCQKAVCARTCMFLCGRNRCSIVLSVCRIHVTHMDGYSQQASFPLDGFQGDTEASSDCAIKCPLLSGFILGRRCCYLHQKYGSQIDHNRKTRSRPIVRIINPKFHPASPKSPQTPPIQYVQHER